MKVACLQITSGPVIAENLEKTGEFIREAAAKGATLIATPENTCHIRFPAIQKRETTPTQQDHPGVAYFADLAKELSVTLLIGSMAVKADGDKLLNRSFVFSSDGKLQDTYDKIHLFDVQLPTGEVHAESEVMGAGDCAVVSHVGDGVKLGLSICYDLRFSYLYRDMAKAGATILAMPAAFTVPTGQAHWETLLRARAIETGSFVIAPAQVGQHEGGRLTYGHSMIINPWGKVLTCLEDGEGVVYADLDLSEVQKARDAIPALQHDRLYTVTTS